jgi:hypothetical protein
MSETKHQKVLAKIFAHPLSHSIEWRELVAALKSIGTLEGEPNGKYHFAYNRHILSLEEPSSKDVNKGEILRLRHFLKQSALGSNA